MNYEITINTSSRNEFIDITQMAEEAAAKYKFGNGILHLFVPHTTAGITINEHADPDVIFDIITYLDKLVPWKSSYKHLEGNSAAHIKASIMGSSASVIVENGKLILGTWQGIFFTEFDGPRKRKVLIKFIPE